eukprot:5594748-Ditylum_brightwellii.AAC.1
MVEQAQQAIAGSFLELLWVQVPKFGAGLVCWERGEPLTGDLEVHMSVQRSINQTGHLGWTYNKT